MAILPNITSGPFTGTGSQTAFPFTFTVASAAELYVLVNNVQQSTSLYTVALNADGTGTVTFSVAPANGASILIVSQPDWTQETIFETDGAYTLAQVNAVNRRDGVRANWLARMLNLIVPSGWQIATARAGKYMAWDASGNPIAASGTGNDAALRTDLALSTGSSLLGFIAAFAGGIARTVQNKLRESVSVLDFGADPTGVADATAAFNNAAAAGPRVYAPAGTYRISALSTLDRDGVVFYGDGPDLTRIIQTSTTADLFTIGAGVSLRYSPMIRDMSFTVASTKTAGYLVKANRTFGLKISNVRCDGYYGLADLIACQWTTIQDTHCVNMVATNGRAVSARSGGSNLILENFVVDGGVGTQCYAGIYAEEWDGIFAGGGTQMNRCGNGLVIAPPATKVFDHLFATNVSLDTCSGVGVLLRASGGQIRRLVYSAGWIGSCSNSGIQVEAGATVTGFLLDGVRVVNNGSYGIFLQAPVENLRITDSVISGNGWTASGTFSGIFIANGGTYTALNISSTAIRPTEGFSNTQRYAIEVQAATGPAFSNCVIEGCDLSGNVTGPAFWASGDPRSIFIRNNAGFITEAIGTATQSSGVATATVTHGLSITPAIGEVIVTPGSNYSPCARFWVDNYTATTFRINTDVAPAAGVQWAWQAVIA